MVKCNATNTGNGKRCKNTRINGFTVCSTHMSKTGYHAHRSRKLGKGTGYPKATNAHSRRTASSPHGYTVSYRTYGRDLEKVPEVFKTKVQAQKFQKLYSFNNPRTKFRVVQATEKHKKRWANLEWIKSRVGYYDWS